MRISVAEVRKIGDKLNINWKEINVKDLAKGAGIEYSKHKKTLGTVNKAVSFAWENLKANKDCYEQE